MCVLWEGLSQLGHPGGVDTSGGDSALHGAIPGTPKHLRAPQGAGGSDRTYQSLHPGQQPLEPGEYPGTSQLSEVTGELLSCGQGGKCPVHCQVHQQRDQHSWPGAALGSDVSVPLFQAGWTPVQVALAETEPPQFHLDGHQAQGAAVSWGWF